MNKSKVKILNIIKYNPAYTANVLGILNSSSQPMNKITKNGLELKIRHVFPRGMRK